MYSFHNKDKITDHAKGCSDSLTTGARLLLLFWIAPMFSPGLPTKNFPPMLLGLWAGQSCCWFPLVLKGLGDPSLTGGLITTLLDWWASGPLLYPRQPMVVLGAWLGHGLRRISEAWTVPPTFHPQCWRRAWLPALPAPGKDGQISLSHPQGGPTRKAKDGASVVEKVKPQLPHQLALHQLSEPQLP